MLRRRNFASRQPSGDDIPKIIAAFNSLTDVEKQVSNMFNVYYSKAHYVQQLIDAL